MGWTLAGLSLVLLVFVLSASQTPLVARIRRRNTREEKIQVINDPQNAKFEIVAVHGLGADPEHTWEGVDLEDKHTRVHLLRGLLPKDFPNARILSYKHNADWLFDSPTQSTDDVSQRLMRHLGEQRNRSGSNLPIIFIGHSFGGLVIKKALCDKNGTDILNNTCGIIFLGTPLKARQHLICTLS